MGLSSTIADSGFFYTTFPVGRLQCNCSILWDPHTLEAVIVDPGDEAERIQAAASTNGLRIKAVLHTHAHFDHIGASKQIHQWSQAPLFLHPGDKMLWDNIQMQGQMFGMHFEPTIPWQQDIEDDLELNFGAYTIRMLHTPGHTPGSCSFSSSNLVLAGDTLFRGSIGRTDLWGGDFSQISKSIKERLYTLDPDTFVITGHGPSTTIGNEQRCNAFVKK